MKILDIALKDLTHAFRTTIMVMFMFGIPLLVTGMFYFMFGSIAGGGQFNLPRTKVVVANLDKDAPRLQAGSKSVPNGIKANTMSDLVVKVLQSDKLANLLEISLAPDAATARLGVDRQQAQVALIIPTDFSRQFADPNGQAVIEFYQDPTLTLGPGVVKSILSQFMDGLSGVKIALNVAQDQLPDKDSYLVGQVVQQYLATSFTHSSDWTAELLDERAPVKQDTQPEASPLARILGPIMSGMMIFFAFYTSTSSAQSLLREAEEGTLSRLFTTPTPQSAILTGKFLSVFLTVLVQITVLLAAGRLIFGILWGSLLSVAVTAAGIVFMAASFGILINSLVKDTKQAGVVFGGVLSFTSMLGMVRIFTSSTSGSADLGNIVSLLVPQGWAIRGLILGINSQPIGTVLLNSLAMLAWGAVFFVIGVWRFNRRYVG